MIKNLFNKKTYIYLSVFRILVSIHIFKKFFFIFINKDIFLNSAFSDKNSSDKLMSLLGVSQNLISQNLVFIVNFILILSILFAFGIFKHITPILIFLLIDIFQRTYIYIPNGGDNLLKFIMFYMIFTDCYRYFTFSKNSKQRNENHISQFLNQCAVLLIKMHLCLIYLVSALFKFNAKVWFNGTATYYTLQLERFQGTSLNTELAKNGIFVTLSTYITLFWELFFPFLVWHKVLKYFIFVSGILIHLGIYIFMMIHDFEILFIMCYGFFISDEEWEEFYHFFCLLKFKIKKRFL